MVRLVLEEVSEGGSRAVSHQDQWGQGMGAGLAAAEVCWSLGPWGPFQPGKGGKVLED